jgi:hypothetical protein
MLTVKSMALTPLIGHHRRAPTMNTTGVGFNPNASTIELPGVGMSLFAPIDAGGEMVTPSPCLPLPRFTSDQWL